MFGYVVLHYQNLEVTIECINKLKKIENESPIAVVDNCSPNCSGEKLKALFEKDEKISVIINKRNEGFAKGNNLGYQFLRHRYRLDCIVVMNNDIMIDDPLFEEKIAKFMEMNNVDVCGPDVVTVAGNHQNPLALSVFTNNFLRRRIIVDSVKYALFHFSPFVAMYLRCKNKRGNVPREKQNTTFNCILHGSCLIYGKRYICAEEEAFLPVTYMYNEEAILYDYLKIKGYRTGYCEDVSILHLEGASTKTISENQKKRLLFRFKNNTKSLRHQLKLRMQYLRRKKTDE